MDTEQQIPDTETCAKMLLATLPQVMRILWGSLRRIHGDDEGPNFKQIRTLEILREHPWTLSDLAARHRIAASTMSRAIDVLERRGWVARTSSPEDRRQVLLTLTEAGREAQELLTEQARMAVAEVMAQLDDQERVRLVQGLEVLQGLARRSNPCVQQAEDS